MCRHLAKNNCDTGGSATFVDVGTDINKVVVVCAFLACVVCCVLFALCGLCVFMFLVCLYIAFLACVIC